jgi:hypothetical protein
MKTKNHNRKISISRKRARKAVRCSNKSQIILKGLQIKSLEKAQKLAYALNIIEEECGIKQTEIVLKDMFLCGWIDKNDLGSTEMECLLRDMLFNE